MSVTSIRLFLGLTSIIFAALLAACGGGGVGGIPNPTSSPSPSPSPTPSPTPVPVIQGRLAYVDDTGRHDRLFVAHTNLAESPQEIVIGPMSVLAAHEAGAQNLTPERIVGMGRPVWNADGTKLALEVKRDDGHVQTIVVDAQTGAATTAGPQLGIVLNRPDLYFGARRLMFAPDWSPNGRYLLHLIADEISPTGVLSYTDLGSGETVRFAQTEGLDITAYRWDQESDGVYVAIRNLQSKPTHSLDPRTVRIDLQTQAQTDVERFGNRTLADLSRPLGAVIPWWDPEFTALMYWPQTEERSTYVATSNELDRGYFYGWMLAGPGIVLGVEEMVSSGRVRMPTLARFDSSAPVNGGRFERFPIYTPVAEKWDFYAID